MKKGFTLVELMVVIAVIAILATIALFGIQKAQAAARDTQRQQIANTMRAAEERYYGDHGTYAADFGALATYMADPTDPGCGTGPQPLTLAGATSVLTPANCTVNPPVSYTITNSGSTADYTITLVKESGGNSVFLSPK